MKQSDASQRFGHFMEGFAAAVELLNRAGANGFSIEYVCLAASVIDGVLRTGLVLQHQIQTQTATIPTSLIYEPDEEKGTTERRIYKMALREQVITAELFDQLERLYKHRNKVIHRYIIGDITTDQVFETALAYEKIIPSISDSIYALEMRQLELGVGMTIAGIEASDSEVRQLIQEIGQRKHGRLSKALRQATKSDDEASTEVQ